MPRLSAVPINLRETEKAELEKLLRRSSTPQQVALRAKIILRAAPGEGHGEISRALDITKDTSHLWRNRWLELSDCEMSVAQRLGATYPTLSASV